MRIVVLEHIPEDPDLQRLWNELALRMESPEVSYTYEWAIAVQRAYSCSLDPLLILGYSHDLLVGVAAFAWKRTIPGQIVFLTADSADYCDFVSAPDDRQPFVAALLSELQNRQIGTIVLTNLPADSASVGAIAAFSSRAPYFLHKRQAYLCARVVLGSPEQRLHLKESLGVKKKLRRSLRKFEKHGASCVRHDQEWQQIEPDLEKFYHAHVARFLATGRVSNLIAAERRTFLYELAHGLCRSGSMVLSRIMLGQTTVAWNYGFRYAGSWFWYQPTVDSSHLYAGLSPGFFLLSKIVESACESSDVDVVDLGLGAEEYKNRFATASRKTLYCALNNSFSVHLRLATRDRAAEIIKRSPQIEKRIRFVMSRFSKLKERARAQGVRSLLSWCFGRVWHAGFASDEVFFFEWHSETQSGLGSARLAPLTSDLLGSAAIHYAHDARTIDFLMRSAKRFRTGRQEGFALLNDDGVPVHLCWVADFHGFEMAELHCRLQSPAKNAVLIFDCFTPVSVRGRGYFGAAIRALAERVREQGKAPWIFSAATNEASLQGIRKSGFEYRFSLGRRKFLFISQVKDSSPMVHPEQALQAPDESEHILARQR